MKGFTGVKHFVLVPDTKPFDRKLARLVLTTLKIPQPNLLIDNHGSSLHPFYAVTDEELSKPALKNLAEKMSSVSGEKMDNDALRQILMMKTKAIVSAILAAAEQTGSATLHENCAQRVMDMLATDCILSGKNQVTSIGVMHVNDGAIGDERAIKMIEELDAKACTLDATRVSEFGEPVVLDAQWLSEGSLAMPFKNGSCWDFEKAQALPPEQCRPESQWPWPHADVFILYHRVDAQTGRADIRGREKSLYISSPIKDPSVIAPHGIVFLGSASGPVAKAKYMKAFEMATPSVIVNHSGRLASLFAEIINVFTRILNGDHSLLRRLSVPMREDETQLSTAPIAARLSAISPSELLRYARTKAGEDAKTPSDPKTSVSVADVAQIIDFVKARPQVFTETIKVVNPIKDTPEQCLEQLSACFSSTYTGVTELGAKAAQVDVVCEAWRMHEALENKAIELRRRATLLIYVAAILGWVAILAAVLLDKLIFCQEGDSVARILSEECRDEDSVVRILSDEGDGKSHSSRLLPGHPFCDAIKASNIFGDSLEVGIEVLRILVVIVPVVSGLIATIASRFQFRQKWSAVTLSAAELVRQIYLFRGEVGPYSMQVSSRNGEAEEEDEEELSPAAKKKQVRMRFVEKIKGICNQVLGVSLSASSVEVQRISSDRLTASAIPQYVRKALYGEQASRTWCCCLQRKSLQKSRITPKASTGGDAQDERTELLSDSGESDARTIEISTQDPDDPLEGIDDYIGPLVCQTYFETRVQSLLGKYQRDAPRLEVEQDFGDLMLFLCGFCASVLGAFQISSWIPVVLGFSAMLSAIMNYKSSGARLIATNQALAGLYNINVQWQALSNVDRRTPLFKAFVISTTEQHAFNVVQAWAGAASVNLGNATGDSENLEEKDSKKSQRKEDKK